MLISSKHTFLSGSWNTYIIEGSRLDDTVTPTDIVKNLEIFKNLYKVKTEFFSYKDLVCFLLTLEEIPANHAKRKRKRKPNAGNAVETKPMKFQFKIAVSVDESLFFCNRSIPGYMKDLFSKFFLATSLVLYDLSGSSPYEMLTFHRQAQSIVDSELLVENFIMDCEEENVQTPNNDLLLKIGSHLLYTPKIKKLTSEVENIPVITKMEYLKDLTLSGVEIEMKGPSIFDIYKSLSKQNLISSLPDWLVACRTNGKTHRKVVYQ